MTTITQHDRREIQQLLANAGTDPWAVRVILALSDGAWRSTLMIADIAGRPTKQQMRDCYNRVLATGAPVEAVKIAHKQGEHVEYYAAGDAYRRWSNGQCVYEHTRDGVCDDPDALADSMSQQ